MSLIKTTIYTVWSDGSVVGYFLSSSEAEKAAEKSGGRFYKRVIWAESMPDLAVTDPAVPTPATGVSADE